MARVGRLASVTSDLFYTRTAAVANTQDQTIVVWHTNKGRVGNINLGSRGLFHASNNTGGDSWGVHYNGATCLRFAFYASTSAGVYDTNNPLNSNYAPHGIAGCDRWYASIATYDYTGKDIESAECGRDGQGRRLTPYRANTQTTAVGTVRSKQRIYVNSREGLEHTPDWVGSCAMLNIKASSRLRMALVRDPWAALLIDRTRRGFFAPLEPNTHRTEFGDESMFNPTVGGAHDVYIDGPNRYIALSRCKSFGRQAVSGTQTINVASIAAATALGVPTLRGIYTISPASIAAATTIGTATLSSIYTILPASIAAGTTFGTATLVPGAVTIFPSGVAATTSFGTPVLTIPSGAYALVVVAPDESSPGVPITIMTELALGDAQTAFDSAPTIRIFTLDPTTGARTVAVNTTMTAAGTAYKYTWTPSANGVYAVYVSGTASGTDYGDSVNTTIRPKFDPIALALDDILVARN